MEYRLVILFTWCQSSVRCDAAGEAEQAHVSWALQQLGPTWLIDDCLLQVPASARVLQVLGQLLSAEQEAADQKFSIEGEESDWEDEYESADEGEGGPDSSFSSPAAIKLEGTSIKGYASCCFADHRKAYK
jgi:hypothetical protein